MKRKKAKRKKAKAVEQTAAQSEEARVSELMVQIRLAVLDIMAGRTPGARLEAWPGRFVDNQTGIKACLVVELSIVPLKDSLQPKIVIAKEYEPVGPIDGKLVPKNRERYD